MLADFGAGATMITSSAHPDDDPRGSDELVGGVEVMAAIQELFKLSVKAADQRSSAVQYLADVIDSESRKQDGFGRLPSFSAWLMSCRDGLHVS